MQEFTPISLPMHLRITAVILCSYCPTNSNATFSGNCNEQKWLQPYFATSDKGNNWASFSVFYLLKADRKKQKSAARSDEERGAEHRNNSYAQMPQADNTGSFVYSFFINTKFVIKMFIPSIQSNSKNNKN